MTASRGAQASTSEPPHTLPSTISTWTSAWAAIGDLEPPTVGEPVRPRLEEPAIREHRAVDRPGHRGGGLTEELPVLVVPLQATSRRTSRSGHRPSPTALSPSVGPGFSFADADGFSDPAGVPVAVADASCGGVPGGPDEGPVWHAATMRHPGDDEEEEPGRSPRRSARTRSDHDPSVAPATGSAERSSRTKAGSTPNTSRIRSGDSTSDGGPSATMRPRSSRTSRGKKCAASPRS